MSVSGMGSTYNSYGYYGNGASSINTMLQSSANSSASNASSGQSSSMPTTDQLFGLAEYAAQAMEAMGVGSDGRVTFSQISKYKETLEEEFEDKIKADFKKLGIPEDTEFTVTFDDDGNIKVKGDDEKVADIQKYFDDNPDMVEKYKEIQLLQDLESAREFMEINPSEMRSRIQLESMSTWWTASGSSSASTMGNLVNTTI